MLTDYPVGQDFSQGMTGLWLQPDVMEWKHFRCFCNTGRTSVKVVTRPSQLIAGEIRLQLLIGEWQWHCRRAHGIGDRYVYSHFFENAICRTIDMSIWSEFYGVCDQWQVPFSFPVSSWLKCGRDDWKWSSNFGPQTENYRVGGWKEPGRLMIMEP